MNRIKHFIKKFDPISLLVGAFIGLAIGASVVNHYAPTTDEMLIMCKMDPQSLREARNSQ